MANYASIDDNATSGITWDEVKSYLSSNYHLTETENFLKITLRFTDDGDRTQLVLIEHSQPSDKLYVEVTSRVGEISPRRLEGVLEMLGKKRFGSLVKIGDNYYVKHALIMNFTPLNVLSDFVGLIGGLADDLEKEFVGGDEN